MSNNNNRIEQLRLHLRAWILLKINTNIMYLISYNYCKALWGGVKGVQLPVVDAEGLPAETTEPETTEEASAGETLLRLGPLLETNDSILTEFS